MADKVYLLPVWLRLWHWTNALLILMLISSGVSLHFAAPKAALIPFSLAREMHNIAGLTLASAYAAFVVASFASGNWREYLRGSPRFWTRLRAQSRYYLSGMFHGQPNPHHPTPEAKFNPLQTLIYGTVMYALMPLLLGSGLIFLWPELAPRELFGLDGLLPIAVLHYVVGFLITLFLLGHIYLATTGRTPATLIRTMISGWHED